jgi:membrane-associated phospholipid phosphatase
VTYIRSVIDPSWTSLLVTPPFPEYTSGHSVQTAAAAQVLTSLFGQLAFTDHTHDARGLPPRAFSSFAAAAEEAAISRLYGGIHFRAAIERGLVQGACIGEQVTALD